MFPYPRVLTAILLWAVALSSHAGINEWTVKGPAGGYYLDFEASSTNPQVFYAAYSRSFFRSSDGGNTWQSRSFVGQVQHIAVDPANGDRIFVSVLDEGLYRSTDGGRTFNQIAPADPRIWASAVGPGNVVYYASELTFRRSNDGGDTFPVTTSVLQGISEILVDPTNADRVYALHGAGLMRSTDGGITWTEQYLPGGSSLYSIVRLTSGTLVLATSDGIYVSADQGDIWMQRYAAWGYSSLAVDSRVPQTIIASGYGGYNLLRGIDDGSSWTPFGSWMQRPAHRVLPSSASTSGLIMANLQGVQLSDDMGATWRYAARGPVASGAALATTVAANSRVYALASWETSLHLSQNDSDWTRVAEGLTPTIGQAVLAVRPGDPDSLVLGAIDKGVYRSEDGGASWSTTVGQLGGMTIESFGFDPVNPAIVYASVSSLTSGPPAASLYRSTDGGTTWAPRSANLPEIHGVSMTVDPADGSRLFLAGRQGAYTGDDIGGLYFSADSGVTWSRTAFDRLNVWAVQIDPANSNRIYAATQTGLHLSTNGGTSFAVSDSFAIATNNMEAGAIAIDPVIPTTLYVTAIDAGYGCCSPQRPSGVLRTVDQGATWETLRANSEAEQWFSGSLVLDPNTPSRLYVSTGLRGVATFEIANDLSVTLSNHSGARTVGLPSTFDLRVTHAGAWAATGVRLVTTLPTGLQDVSATTDRGTCAVSGATLTCTIAVLRPTQVANIHVTYTPAAAALLDVVTTLSAHENDSALQNNGAQASATAGEVVDLALGASPDTTADHGGSLNLAFTVSNAGPTAASAATFTMSVTDGLALGALPVGCVKAGLIVSCALSAIPVGETLSLQFPVSVQALGNLTASATVAAAPAAIDINTQNDTALTTIAATAVADVSVSVTDSADPVLTGTTFSYSVTVRNDGPDPATGVIASVTAPGTVSAITSSQGTCSTTGDTSQCQLGEIATGAMATITITTLSATAANLTASATVSSTTVDRVSGNNSAQQATTINAPAAGGGGGSSSGGGSNSGGGGGGGGATDPLLLLIAMALTAATARRRPARVR